MRYITDKEISSLVRVMTFSRGEPENDTGSPDLPDLLGFPRSEEDAFGLAGPYNPMDVHEGDSDSSRGIGSSGSYPNESPIDFPTLLQPAEETGIRINKTTQETNLNEINATSGNRIALDTGDAGGGYLTTRELTILLTTLIPAIVVILTLLAILIYFIMKQQKRSRVGMHIEHKFPENGQIRSSTETNGQAIQPDQVSGSVRNGTPNGVARAWENNEVSSRHELTNH